MSPLTRLLAGNREWVAERVAADPAFFERQASHHAPIYLWIGCSDARVPANVITRTDAGEMFVHRNIANLVAPTDHNLLAVLEYAIEVRGVRDVVVCGHEGCGGVRAALGGVTGLQDVDGWLAPVRALHARHAEALAALAADDARHRRLVALNVAEQVAMLHTLRVVRDAWDRGATLRLHGIVYDIADGVLRDLRVGHVDD